jgi:PAS domain S-box-containing protein
MLIAIIDPTTLAQTLKAQLLRIGVDSIELFPTVEEATHSIRHLTPDCVLLHDALNTGHGTILPRTQLYHALQAPVICYRADNPAQLVSTHTRATHHDIVLPIDDELLKMTIDRACRRQVALDDAREDRERCEALMALCSDGVIALHPDFSISSVNPRAYELLRRAPDPADIGLNVFTFCRAADSEQEHAVLQHLATEYELHNYAYRYVSPESESITMELSCSGSRDVFGNVRSWLFVFRLASPSPSDSGPDSTSVFVPSAEPVHSPRIDALVSSMVDDLRRLVSQAERGRVFLRSSLLDEFMLVRTFGYSDVRHQFVANPLPPDHLQVIARGRSGMLMDGVHFHDPAEQSQPDSFSLTTRCALAMPFTLRDDLSGLLILESTQTGAFTDKDLELVTMYIEHLSLIAGKDHSSSSPATPPDDASASGHGRAGMFRAMLDGTVLGCDDVYAGLLGYESAEEIVGDNRYDFYKDKSRKTSEEKILPGGQTVIHDELQLVRKDGSTAWFLETSVIIYDRRLHTQIVEGTLISIDDRAGIRGDSSLAGDQYLGLLNALPVPVWRCNANGKRNYVNSAWEKFTGINADQASSIFHADLIHHDDLRTYLQAFFNGLEGYEPIESEYRLRHHSGEYRTIVEYCHPLFNLDRQFAGYIGIAIDHAHPTHLANELRKAQVQLEQVDSVKTSFLTTISHEIRTPLNIVLGFADLLHALMLDRMTDEEQKHFDNIHLGGQRLLRTFDHILEYSKLQSGSTVTRMTLINVSEHVQKVCNAFRPQAIAKGLHMEETYPDSPVFLVADSILLTHSLDNLIDNAIKFSPSGLVAVRVSRVAGSASIEIIDEGVGISEEYQRHIFEICTQEESDYSRPFEGAGLGLALTKAYVELNRGSISFRSRKGEGTAMELRFPLADQSELRPYSEPRKFQGSYTPRKVRDIPNVLVAEDDPQSQQFMKAVLQTDYHVHLAANGTDVWHIVTTQQIDVIIMDLSLRGSQDGVQLTRRIRSHTATKDIPIIALTAHTMPQDRQRCMDAGCNVFQPKPVSVKELKRHLDDLLSLSIPRVPVS